MTQPNPTPVADPRELVLVKQGQRYVFRYAQGEEQKMLDSLVRMARDAACELDWFDAAVLCHQLGRGLGDQLQQMRAEAR